MADRKTASLAHVDTDETELWDTPAKPAQRSSNPTGDATSKANIPRTYEDADAKESALRQELASVRKVNEAIEGVIYNLEQAQNNMKVGCVAMKLIIELTASDCQPDGRSRIYPSQHLDTYPVSDRTQSAPNSRPIVARHKPGYGGHRSRGRRQATSSSSQRSRRARAQSCCRPEGRRGGQKAYGRSYKAVQNISARTRPNWYKSRHECGETNGVLRLRNL
jgi:hypothetical protein